MRIVFWGTSQFAVPSLERLALSRHKVVLVVTQPDKRQGRHLMLRPPPVKIEAERLKIKIAQPDDLNNEGLAEHLRGVDAELFAVVSYGKILKRKMLEIPRLYCINLHASLLPKYRGAAPINWAVLNGENETGLTVIRMNEEMDGGDILAQKRLPIFEEDNAVSLGERLGQEGSELLLETIDLIEKGRVKFLPQDESLASFAPVIKKKDGRIVWQDSATRLHNQARALQPWPGTYCFLGNGLLKIWKTKVVDDDYSGGMPGEIVAIQKEGIVVAAGKGNLLIEELQVAGGKRMSAEKFLLGHRLKPGERLE